MVTVTGPNSLLCGKAHIRVPSSCQAVVASCDPKKHCVDRGRCEQNTVTLIPPATCEDSSDEDLKLVLEANPTEMKTSLRLSASGFQKTRL